MNRKPDKVYVWGVSSRIVHWMLALSFMGAFISSFYEEALQTHVAFGFLFLIMIVYRIIWGFIGPRYATFNSFKLSPKAFKNYFVEKVQNRWRSIPAGHNPASSWFTLWALGMGSIIVSSGVLLYGIQEAQGIFSYLNDNYTSYSPLLATLHQYASYIFMAWVLVHITGVMIEQFWHKTNMVFAMITGYKKTQGEDAVVSKSLTFFAFFMIFFALAIYFFIVSTDDNFLIKSKYTNIDYAQRSPVYAKKCGACHKPYPPYLLPQQSWKRIMKSLNNHRGEKITDANISKVQQASILEFLTNNSAETSQREASVKMMHSLGALRPKAITKTPYWRETHKNIPSWVYHTKKVKKKSNCFSCHRDIEYGSLEDRNIVRNY